MQIKTTLKYQFVHIILAKIPKVYNTVCPQYGVE